MCECTGGRAKYLPPSPVLRIVGLKTMAKLETDIMFFCE